MATFLRDHDDDLAEARINRYSILPRDWQKHPAACPNGLTARRAKQPAKQTARPGITTELTAFLPAFGTAVPTTLRD